MSLLEQRAQEADALNTYAAYTRDVLIPQLWNLCVPWRFLAWRRLHKEIERRNAYVRAELTRMGR